MFKNRHHQNHSKQPGKQRKQDKICLSGAYTWCCYCVKSELFCPRCLNEQLFAANNSRPRDVACDSRAEGCYDWFCRCRAFLVLFERQKAHIERLEVKYKWTIKVEDCSRMWPVSESDVFAPYSLLVSRWKPRKAWTVVAGRPAPNRDNDTQRKPSLSLFCHFFVTIFSRFCIFSRFLAKILRSTCNWRY